MTANTAARRALEILDESLELPESEREAFVHSRCGSDDALLAEVRQLMRASRRVAGLLDFAPPARALQDLSPAIVAALRDRFQITREIGRGGMATVFLARERKHDRDVVIKVLDPSIAHVFGAERFHREVRIAATLAHPHIVPLIDSGDTDGFLYYVMPWMEGETLRERLRLDDVGVDEAIRILRDIAGALAFAHEAGVVHRDLKPENVFVTAGHAYLLDFGIAKLLNDSTAAASITLPGVPIGTRRYMAPEQAFGAADVDARVDVYTWGLLGIEMLTGELLTVGDAAAAAPALLDKRSDIPPALASLLRDCLATSERERPADMNAVVARLDAVAPSTSRTTRFTRRTGWALGAALVVAVAAGAFAWRANTDAATAFGIADPFAATVLRNETGDSTLNVIGRFAGDWVTDALERVDGVRVVPWSEALVASDHALQTNAPLVATMRDDVKAGTVLTGAFYRTHDSLQFRAQLVDARTARVVSTLAPIVVPADNPESGIAQLRDRVRGAVAAARDERVATVPDITRNPPTFAAYQSFDYGLDRFLAQNYDDALVSFREAFRRDTTFTAALLLGARAAWNTREFGVADSLVSRARAQRRELGVYNESSLRFIEALSQGDGRKARDAIRRAAELSPNSRAGFDLAAALLNAGFAREALEQLRKMDPDRGAMRGWSSYWTQLSHAAYLIGDYDGSIRAAREMQRRYPDRRVAQVLEARALAAAGDTRRLDSALTAWESLPSNVYWSQGGAMIVAGEELIRRGEVENGRRYSERGVAWLMSRLVATPNDRGHRDWLINGLYDLGRDDEARVAIESLAREFPDRLRFRGLAAMLAIRRGDRAGAEAWLKGTTPREAGELLGYRARMAAIQGDTEGAVALLTNALDQGIEGFSWLPGTAYRDFAVIAKDPRGKALLSGR